jgi:hypothetical protein
MEADWSVALAADDPVITVPWTASEGHDRKCRFVDLRRGGHLIEEIEEVQARPALRSALLLLNDSASPLWTAKCDAWTSSPDEGAEPFDATRWMPRREKQPLGPAATLTCYPAMLRFSLVSNARSTGFAL